ncbi:MAG: hypothetical protein ACI8QC_004295 [Planctomycetota bacterium]|jgi:hypothetical protein
MSCTPLPGSTRPGETSNPSDWFDGGWGDKLAVVSFNLEGFSETTSPMREVPAHIRALVDQAHQATEKRLREDFKVVPTASFIKSSDYRDAALEGAVAGTYVPVIDGTEMVNYTKDRDAFDEAYMPRKRVERLAATLGVKLIAVVRSRWFVGRVDTGSASGPNIRVFQPIVFNETWMTIYRRDGTILHRGYKKTGKAISTSLASGETSMGGGNTRDAQTEATTRKDAGGAAFIEAHREAISSLLKHYLNGSR